MPSPMELVRSMNAVTGMFRYPFSDDENERWRRALQKMKVEWGELEEFLDEATDYGTRVGKPWQLLEMLGPWLRQRRGKPSLVPASICPEMHPPAHPDGGVWPPNTAYRCQDCGSTHMFPESEMATQSASIIEVEF